MNKTDVVNSNKLGDLGVTLGSTLDLLNLLLDDIEKNAPGKQWDSEENSVRAELFGHGAPYLRALALASSKMIKEVLTEIERIEKLFERAELQGSVSE